MNSNYIEKIFGKLPSEVTLNDIKEYFSSPQEESSIIEFKSGEVEIKVKGDSAKEYNTRNFDAD